ncbi:23128_t:CDS:2 [Gigaspora margarita]|uniref:23128_t:CDS:1 n=1 Tax=Gigaspora margarita TaxID=4874 RepID=A0ABN7W543_GIGMA|nr:23128_t:CDS:2 [Gigaspora margarita]
MSSMSSYEFSCSEFTSSTQILQQTQFRQKDLSIEQLINDFHKLNIKDTNNQSQDKQETKIRVSTINLIIQSINQVLSKRPKVLLPNYDKNGNFFSYVQTMNQFASLISTIYKNALINGSKSSKLSGNTKCPRCGVYYKDLNGHVVRIHKTTLSILKRQVAQNVQDQDVQVQTRQDRRNERLYNKSRIIKKIDGYLRNLRNQKLNALKEDEFIFDVEVYQFKKIR